VSETVVSPAVAGYHLQGDRPCLHLQPDEIVRRARQRSYQGLAGTATAAVAAAAVAAVDAADGSRCIDLRSLS